MTEADEQKRARIHREQEGRQWFQPTPAFVNWWEPTGFNPKTGAQTGGHSDAFRRCVKPETGEVAYFGIKTVVAYNMKEYRAEFHEWLRDGRPDRDYLVDGTAGTKKQHAECFAEVRRILGNAQLGVII